MSHLDDVADFWTERTLDEAIEAVQDFRWGAERRRDLSTVGTSVWRYFDGKADAYADVATWLRAKKEGLV